MMMIISALIVWSVSSCAIDKANVSLNGGNSSGSNVSLNGGNSSRYGGGKREESFNVKITKGFRHNIPIDDKIAALEQKIIFYKLLKKHHIDINQKIDGNYTNLQLRSVLETLLPGIKIKFNGVGEEITIANMTVKQSRLESVLDSLDNAAGVYFQFTKRGLTVSGMPPNIHIND